MYCFAGQTSIPGTLCQCSGLFARSGVSKGQWNREAVRLFSTAPKTPLLKVFRLDRSVCLYAKRWKDSIRSYNEEFAFNANLRRRKRSGWVRCWSFVWVLIHGRFFPVSSRRTTGHQLVVAIPKWLKIADNRFSGVGGVIGLPLRSFCGCTQKNATASGRLKSVLPQGVEP